MTNDQYEYKTAAILGQKIELSALLMQLNQAGDDGWEMCGILPSSQAPLLVFKRKKSPIIIPKR